MLKLILLCLVVATVFAKPKGSIELADAETIDSAMMKYGRLAKHVAPNETDKAVEEAKRASECICMGVSAFMCIWTDCQP